MRLKINGDWAAPIVFSLFSAFYFLQFYLNLSEATNFVGEVMFANSPVLIYTLILAGISSLITIASIIAALRGRTVPDGSTWETWQNVGLDWRGIIGGLGLLILGSGFPIIIFDRSFSVLGIIFILAMSFGFLYAGIKLTLGARIVVMTPEKSIIILKGKPLTFSRKVYRHEDFTELRLVTDQPNIGGLNAYHPMTVYKIFGLHHGRGVELSRTTVATEVQQMVDNLATTLNLPAQRFQHPNNQEYPNCT